MIKDISTRGTTSPHPVRDLTKDPTREYVPEIGCFALVFSGQDYIVFDNCADFLAGYSGRYVIQFWVNIGTPLSYTNPNTQYSGDRYTLLFNGYYEGSTIQRAYEIGVAFRRNSSGQHHPVIYVSGIPHADSAPLYSITDLQFDTWHHVALQRGFRYNNMELYIDGQLSNTWRHADPVQNVSNGFLIIGALVKGFHTGPITEYRLFKGKLANPEIVMGGYLYEDNFTPVHKCYVGRIVVGGGQTSSSSQSNVIYYINPAQMGSTVKNFGNLSLGRNSLSSTSNGTNQRAIFTGGYATSPVNVIDYVTIAISDENAQPFGNLMMEITNTSATSNNTDNIGVIFGGNDSSGRTNQIQQVNIDTTGDATSFGILSTQKSQTTATSNGLDQRGLIFNGIDASNSRCDTIEYVTINTPSNSLTFGVTQNQMSDRAATSNLRDQMAVVGGGVISTGSLTLIEKVRIDTISNSTTFGNLTYHAYVLSAASNGSDQRGLFIGGIDISAYNKIDYVTIDTPSNASDFGSTLPTTMYRHAATSNA